MPKPTLTGDPVIDQFITSGDVDAMHDVLEERIRQNVCWGEQSHPPSAWLSILLEEVGEVARAVNKLTFGPGSHLPLYWEEYEAEVAQVAAVALAMLAHRVRVRREAESEEE